MRWDWVSALVLAVLLVVVVGGAALILNIEANRNEAVGYCAAKGLIAVDSATSGGYLCIEGIPVP